MRALFSGAVLWFSLAAITALAQSYPSRPIRMIVPFPPSAGVDVVARLLGVGLTERTGQNVVIDNRIGAGGTIGIEAAARAPADGYTLLAVPTSHAVNVSLYKKLSYDALRDFAPITLVATTPNVLVTSLGVPASSVKEVIALANAKPKTLNFGSAGVGSASHIAGELFRLLAGVEIVHVPYKGSGPALVGLLGDQVQLAFFSIPSTLPHVKSGRLRMIAIGSVSRSPLLPSLPTIAEAGVPGYEAVVWYGIEAPARTSRSIIDKLNREIIAWSQSAEAKERLANQGAEPRTSSPEEFAAYLKSEIAKYARVVKEAGLQPE